MGTNTPTTPSQPDAESPSLNRRFPQTSPVALRRWLIVGTVAAVGFVLLTILLARALPSTTGIDWYHSYRPAVWNILRLQSPYTVDFQNPPWTLVFLFPFALLPPEVGRAALLLIGFAGFAYFGLARGARPLVLALFLTSPPVLHSLINSGIDWLVLLGLLMPPQIGLLFVVIKPQIGIAVVLFWLIEAWRKGGWREIVHVFWPLTAIMLLSFVIFGLWPLQMGVNLEESVWWNASLWPASIPVGLALLVASIRTRKIEYAMGASPCLSPYVLLHSWVGAFAALLRRTPEFVAAWIGLWTWVLISAGILPSF